MANEQKKSLRTKQKNKIAFAKNKKQIGIMLFVLILFISNTIYMVIKHLSNNNNNSTNVNQNFENLENVNIQGLEENPENIIEPIQSQNNSEGTIQDQDLAKDANDIYSQTLKTNENSQNMQPSLSKMPDSKNVSEVSGEETDILSKKSSAKSAKTVLITINNSGRANPFLPANEFLLPESLTYLPTPPETLPEDTDAVKVIGTTISGIMYDKYSPSAIINIEGTDYLVKKGDVINHYKVLSIEKNLVTVKLGENIYKAGVGELLSKTDLKYSNIANLEKKFGGNAVSINVKKKGY
jgi:hypothetical protein